ncbi:MAG: DNA polymerase III subunit delta [Deltaproteobacteria bacterium GWC2_42_11]|nr:MAG: DNA polymerase III subunit delta [Deltaproteobacteria bacterium GWC2_42_11]HBO84246.1 DNA polymerase III subunit delta [Deltaproteobacteria bacterium]
MAIQSVFDRLKKKEPLHVYYLYSKENFLLEEALSILKEALLSSAMKDLNCHTFHIRESDISSIISTGYTMPFMAERRVIIIKGMEDINAAQSQQLAEYIKNPCSTTSLVLIAHTGKIEKGNALILELERRGCIFPLNAISKKELPLWVKTGVKNAGKEISEEAVDYLTGMVGEDLMDIKAEIDKLILFTGNKSVIDMADVEAVVSDIKVNSMFDLTDSIGRKDFKSALKALNKIIEGGEQPVRILGMIARQFRILLKIKTLRKKGTPANRIAGIAGIFPYHLDNYIKQSSQFTEDELVDIFDKLHRTDIAIKSERLHRLIFEKLVMDLCLGKVTQSR